MGEITVQPVRNARGHNSNWLPIVNVSVRALGKCKVADRWWRSQVSSFPMCHKYINKSEYFYSGVQQPLCRAKQLRESQCSRLKMPWVSITAWFRSSSNPTMMLSSSSNVLPEEVSLGQQTLQWAFTCSALQKRNNSSQINTGTRSDHTALLNFT